MPHFKYGAVDYPLTASTTNSLLRDVDPALYYALDFFAAMIRVHDGARLLVEASQLGLNLPDAVVQSTHVEPVPLRSDQFKFPMLSIFRKSSAFSNRTMTYDQDIGSWEIAYILPPLATTRAREALEPILVGVATTIRAMCLVDSHPSYQSGLKVWNAAGIERIELVSVEFGGYKPIPTNDELYRAVFGTLAVVEREMPTIVGLELFDGADADIDHKQPDGDLLEDVVSIRTQQPPILTSIDPNSGTKVGGTSLTITGDRFLNPARVLFEGTVPVDAHVVDAQHITCVTPAHVANPTFMADVTVLNGDGQKIRVPAAFTFTSP